MSRQPNIAAITAIAAVRSTERDKFLAPEANAAIPTVAGLNRDRRLVNEFHGR
jgi:hypothetical protein